MIELQFIGSENGESVTKDVPPEELRKRAGANEHNLRVMPHQTVSVYGAFNGTSSYCRVPEISGPSGTLVPGAEGRTGARP